jgi:hypothetical protein
MGSFYKFSDNYAQKYLFFDTLAKNREKVFEMFSRENLRTDRNAGIRQKRKFTRQ